MMQQATWRPAASGFTSGRRPQVGQILAFNFEAWRVLDITDVLPLDPAAQQYIVGLRRLFAGVETGKRHIMTVTEGPAPDPTRFKPGFLDANPDYRRGRSPYFDVLPEHYSVCARCGDVQPCREVWAERQGKAAMDEMARFDDPSVCPACQEVITLRQKTLALPNIISIMGGKVNFHAGRYQCVRYAADYEKRLLKAGAVTALTLSCDGRLIQHRDGTLECLNLDCPNVGIEHHNFMHCQYRSHGCSRLECQLWVAS